MPAYPPALIEAALALHDNRLPEAERGLKDYLKRDPFDARAVRMLAELAGRIGRYRDAETLLRRALELAPAFTAARTNLALLLHRQSRSAEALAELEVAIAEAPAEIGARNLKAAALNRVGGFDEALAIYRDVLARAPDAPKVWMSYAHTLKTVGRLEDSIAAYRAALARAPTLGEVWWSLANLKTYRFDEADVLAMERALEVAELATEDRFHLHFALGKAREDRGEAAAAFPHYAEGNALRRCGLDYDAARTTRQVEAGIARFDSALLAARAGAGHDAQGPIFVVGMPRAGSTLVEQILASHSCVEGTSELADLPLLARRHGADPASLADLPPDRLAAIGRDYLERTRIHRRTDRPFFVDKLPNNWALVPLILLALPNARIVDARRHPLACGFSNFKQHYARGQGFSYDLGDMGLYYRDYVRLMAHVDAVAPGRVHRVVHEGLIEDPEAGTRALLAACGLAFEPACLTSHRTERAIRTPSSEQVRRPINRAGTKAWMPFEAWLGPLKAALGDVLDAYPAAPAIPPPMLHPGNVR